MRCYGYEALISALYRYGAPPELFALHALLKGETEKKFCREYTAQMLYMTVRALYPGANVPNYMAMVSPQTADNRTGDEIVADMIKKLKDRRES